MSAEDRISKFDALDILRRAQRKKSDEDLWLILRDHATGFPLEWKYREDGVAEIISVVEPPSDGLDVHWRRTAAPFLVPMFFRPDVERLAESIGKSAYAYLETDAPPALRDRGGRPPVKQWAKEILVEMYPPDGQWPASCPIKQVLEEVNAEMMRRHKCTIEEVTLNNARKELLVTPAGAPRQSDVVDQ